MQPASQVDRLRYRVGLVICSASWKSDKGSVQCCTTLFFCYRSSFYLSYSTWYISSAYQQVGLVLFSGVCFSLTAKSFACIFELPSVTTLPCQNKTMRSFWCSAHFALSTETQVGFLERRGRHYFFRTVVVARKQTFADAPLIYNRTELNRIDCALLSSSQNWKSHLVSA